jgi:Flp pilus assembly protein TadG
MKRIRKPKRTRGMAMVEMVFVLPILVLLVFAIAQFGLMFNRWLTLSNAVREGSRLAVAFRGTQPQCTAQGMTTQVKDKVVSYARAGGIPLTAAAVTVNPDPPCPPDPAAGVPITVDALYNFPINIPFWSGGGNMPLRYSSTMRHE